MNMQKLGKQNVASSFLTFLSDLDIEKITLDTPGPHSYPDIESGASLISIILKFCMN